MCRAAACVMLSTARDPEQRQKNAQQEEGGGGAAPPFLRTGGLYEDRRSDKKVQEAEKSDPGGDGSETRRDSPGGE